jgi:hypothetical protein
VGSTRHGFHLKSRVEGLQTPPTPLLHATLIGVSRDGVEIKTQHSTLKWHLLCKSRLPLGRFILFVFYRRCWMGRKTRRNSTATLNSELDAYKFPLTTKQPTCSSLSMQTQWLLLKGIENVTGDRADREKFRRPLLTSPRSALVTPPRHSRCPRRLPRCHSYLIKS